MTLKNVNVYTFYEYTNDADENSCYRGEIGKIHFLKIEIPIAGGIVVFKYKITEEESKALEAAATLGAKIK